MTEQHSCKVEQPRSFSFTEENMARLREIISCYPEGRQASAVIPALDLAQRQMGGWVPRVAMNEVARILAMPEIKVYEVATFYSMFNLNPVGKYFIQVCGTTPCWLKGAHDLIDVCKNKLGISKGETTKDGKFTLTEVECLGACVNAPMVQINDDYYEDLNKENFEELLNNLASDKEVKVGSQIGRFGSAPEGVPITLKAGS